jgi:hypothetical protein
MRRDFTFSPLASVPTLDALPLEALIKLRDELNERISTRQSRERLDALLYIRERMLSHGITVKDLHESMKRRRKRRGTK